MNRGIEVRCGILLFGGACLLAMPGCAGGGFLAYLFGGGEAIPAVYVLEDRTTVVLVDDPNAVLGSSALPGVVANNVGHHLEKEEVFETARIVPNDEVVALQQRLGEEFNLTPIDQVGRTLGAEQVIHVEIEAATLYYQTQQVVRPRCTLRVKVIDVINSRRLFPESRAMLDRSVNPPGHPVSVEMSYHGADSGGAGVEMILAQRLAEEAGKEVAQLFYDHNEPPPGQMIR